VHEPPGAGRPSAVINGGSMTAGKTRYRDSVSGPDMLRDLVWVVANALRDFYPRIALSPRMWREFSYTGLGLEIFCREAMPRKACLVV
jgi:hypothetical protein